MKFSQLISIIRRDLSGHGGKGFFRGLLTFWFNQPFRLVMNYRIGHYLHRNRNILNSILILVLKKHQIKHRNCDIAYSAVIGEGIKFPHPLSVIIGDSSRIGNNVMIWHDVTLGSSGKPGMDKQYPVIGDNTRIYTGAKIIGGIKVGSHSVIAANAVLSVDIPESSVAAGIPAKVVKTYVRNERSLPNFILGGIMKSGTTNLDDYLRRHKDIFMVSRSMNNSFFDNNDIYARGIEWYKKLFAEPGNVKLLGQTSADCAFNDQSALRIKEYIPDCKLIFILRNPIERGYSQYWHQIRMAREYLSWEGVIEKEEERMKKSYFNYRMYSYVIRGKYKSQFDVYFSLFPRDQIMIIPFEFMIKNELFVVNKVLKFIGLNEINNLTDLIPDPGEKKTNPAMLPKSKLILYIAYLLQKFGFIRTGRFLLNKFVVAERPPKMNPETRKKLEAYYSEDLKFYDEIYRSWEVDLSAGKNN